MYFAGSDSPFLPAATDALLGRGQKHLMRDV
jgi:hypothetical protein